MVYQTNANLTQKNNKYQKHSSFCYYVKCFDDSIYSQGLVLYTAQCEEDDIAKKFVDTLEDNIKQIYTIYKFPKKLIFTKKDCESYNATNVCYIYAVVIQVKIKLEITVMLAVNLGTLRIVNVI